MDTLIIFENKEQNLNYNILFTMFFSAILLTSAISQNAFGTKENLIPWNEDKKLTWDDFQGYTLASPYYAYTTWYVSFDYSWKFSNANGCFYEFSKISATANFDKSKSWVKKGQEADWLLKHEQGHFDIAGIFAKEFNERVQIELMEKDFPCPHGTQDSNTINNQARNQVQFIFDQEHKKALDMEKHYDNETNGGNNNNKQIEWDKKIQLFLDVEREFESPAVESEPFTIRQSEFPEPGGFGCVFEWNCLIRWLTSIDQTPFDFFTDILSFK